MAALPKVERMKLAITAYKNGQFSSKTAAAKAFDVPPQTLMTRLNGTTFRKETVANCQKLSETEESTLSAWIIDTAKHGLPPQISTV
jgi:hypothetical protein